MTTDDDSIAQPCVKKMREQSAEIESLRAQLANEKSAATEIYQALENSRAMLLATQAHAARVVEALEFYANDNHVEYLHGKRDWESDREALKARGFTFEGEDGNGGETFVERGNMAQAALSTPTNLDALHEALARECERLAHLFPRGSMHAHKMLEEAAYHRAKKGGG